ncbi:MAG: alpha-amylase family glycosyl hydrolase [Chloroflexota bacterium]
MKKPLRITRTRHPVLLSLDARAWLERLSRDSGRRIRLGDVPSEAIEAILASGPDLVWLTGVWQIGAAARTVARKRYEGWPTGPGDLGADDLVGSPDAIADYIVPRALGGDEGLARLRLQLAVHGVGLVLDFVPNHTSVDHRWVRDHPDWYVNADREQAEREPGAWFSVRVDGRTRWIAHGRGNGLPPMPETAQLDYRVADLRQTMIDELLHIALRCDGVRVDMAMLALDDVFRASWQHDSVSPQDGDAPAGEFWWHAIHTARKRYPGLLMIGEAYAGTEHRLQQLGFDQTYDKVLLDRLRTGPGSAVAAHLRADITYQSRSLRYLENPDEPRVTESLPPARQRSAALVTATVPGMLLLHDGQLEGARIQTPVEYGRRPDEPVDPAIRGFYDRLLRAIDSDAFRQGSATRVEPRAVWEGDPTNTSFVVWMWFGPRGSVRLAVANLGPTTGRCFVPLQLPDFAGRSIVFEDLLSDARYERDGDDLIHRGLFLELPPDGYHLFRVLGHRPRPANGEAE